ncbi:RidA family protein [Pricia sp.]|uniref:RidA family protein n=1 Tax=Pricia sp. TaxID=2268138 RepID=UPI003594463C
MKKEYINPKTLFDSRPHGFSQVVVARPGKMAFISGQVAWDANLNIVGKNDLASQTKKSLGNLKTAMEAAGGTLEDIVMLRIYKVNYQKEDGAVISQILKEYFNTQNLPASTWINVKGLANEAFLIEIEAQAVI